MRLARLALAARLLARDGSRVPVFPCIFREAGRMPFYPAWRSTQVSRGAASRDVLVATSGTTEFAAAGERGGRLLAAHWGFSRDR